MNLRTLKLESEITAAIKTFLDFGDTYKEIELTKQILKIINSEPITVDCKDCNGYGSNVEVRLNEEMELKCKNPHCTDGQRTLMKVRKCPNCYDELFNTFMGADDCEECLNGKITEPLTLADIDWGKSKLKLKKGWEVEE